MGGVFSHGDRGKTAEGAGPLWETRKGAKKIGEPGLSVDSQNAFVSDAMPKFPARVQPILARKENRAIAIRRGPSKSVCPMGWDRGNDIPARPVDMHFEAIPAPY
jgi:hypothetical protein